jgi:hypothetical protein
MFFVFYQANVAGFAPNAFFSSLLGLRNFYAEVLKAEMCRSIVM